MKPLGIAVWGLGRHALTKIVPAIAHSPALRLVGVVSRNESTVRECATQWQCHGWTSSEAALSDAGVDVVYLATPIGLHASQGLAVLAAGKHLWCEKPIAASLDEALELLRAARAGDLSLCEGFMYLHHPQFGEMKRHASDGSLGRIRSICCRFGIPALENPGFRDKPELGGGAMLDVGSYATSAVLSLVEAEDLRVESARITAAPGSAVDTDGWAVLSTPGGIIATLEWRINCAYRNELDIWGSDGSVFSDRIFSKPADFVPEFRLRDAKGDERRVPGQAADHFRAMLEAFRWTISDPDRAAVERDRIEARARLLDRIALVARRGADDRPAQ